jgi:hypothetical protein
VSPDDVALVDRSWSELRRLRDPLVVRLTCSLTCAGSPAARAEWLVDSVAELVGLLTTPSQLGRRARLVALTRPCPGSPPSFSVDGMAWMGAARDVCPTWSARTERAWRQAWLLLSEVLAEESLSPFAGP